MDTGDFSLVNKILGNLEGHRVQDNSYLVADVMELRRGPLGSSGSGSGNGNGENENKGKAGNGNGNSNGEGEGQSGQTGNN